MQIAIGLFEEFTALDAIGPYQVLSRLPDVDLVLCAEHRGTVDDDNGLLQLSIGRTFDEVCEPDVILIPGGFVTRTMARRGHPIVDWIAATHQGTKFTTSVCTGSLLLGAAGLLEGLDATTHWMAYEELASYGARPTETRVVRRDRIWTAAGVSAGIDLALMLAAELAGPQVAQALQLAIEYDPQPPFDSGSPTKADPEIVALVRAVSEAREVPADPR